MADRLIALAILMLRPVEAWHMRRARRYNATHHGRPTTPTRRWWSR